MNDWKVQTYRREDGLYDWRLIAGNGEIVATSGGQGFTERNGAREGWERVEDAITDRVTDAHTNPPGRSALYTPLPIEEVE